MHVKSRSVIEKEFSSLIKSSKTQYIVFVSLLSPQGDQNAKLVVDSKPLRLFWMDNFIIIPLEKSKIGKFCQSLFVKWVWIFLIVIIWQKSAFFIISVQVPPRSEVVSRSTPVLNYIVLYEESSCVV